MPPMKVMKKTKQEAKAKKNSSVAPSAAAGKKITTPKPSGKKSIAQTPRPSGKKVKEAASVTPVKKSAMKKEKKVDPIAQRVKHIEQVLAYSEDEVVTNMLTNVCAGAFTRGLQSRTVYESKVITMIKEACCTLRDQATTEKTAKEQQLAQSQAQSGHLQEQLAGLKQALEVKKEQIKQQDALLKKTETELKTQQEAKKQWLSDARKFRREVEQAKNDVEETIEAYAHVKTLRDDPPPQAKERKKLIAFITPLLKKMQVDQSLIQAAPMALMKDPSTRGIFDNTAVDSIDQGYIFYLDGLHKRKMALEPQRIASEQEEMQMQEAIDFKATSLQVASDQAKMLASHLQELQGQIKDSEKASKAAERDLEEVTDIYTAAVEKKQEIDTAVQYVDELVNRPLDDTFDSEPAEEDDEMVAVDESEYAN